MLSTHEQHEIDHEIPKFEHKRAACLEALLIVQKSRGYVSDEAIQDVAAYLEMSPTELDSIGSFYNLIYRKPVGKNVIRICDSVTCWIKGYDQIRRSLQEHLGIGLGETSSDGKFTLLPAQCLGTCDKAPALMINDELHRNLTSESTVQLVMKKAAATA